MCLKPYRQGVAEYGCGQCMPCRISSRRLWATRLMLEARKHVCSLFVTLTYSNAHLPVGGTLVPADMQGFLKRVRAAVWPMRVRFYGVGEYGERGQRPHYHLCLFAADEVRLREAIKSCWTFADIETDVRVLGWDLAWYIVGYICNKRTNNRDQKNQEWLRGRHPEFARMSLKPGIGAEAVEDFAVALDTEAGKRWIVQAGDVPSSVKVEGKELPIGRYLKKRLRGACGVTVPKGGLSFVEAAKVAEIFGAFELHGAKKFFELREGVRGHDALRAAARHRIAKSKRTL